jgi:hypothetical protein
LSLEIAKTKFQKGFFFGTPFIKFLASKCCLKYLGNLSKETKCFLVGENIRNCSKF